MCDVAVAVVVSRGIVVVDGVVGLGVDVGVVGLLWFRVGGAGGGRRIGLIGAVGVVVAAAECRSLEVSVLCCWVPQLLFCRPPPTRFLFCREV